MPLESFNRTRASLICLIRLSEQEALPQSPLWTRQACRCSHLRALRWVFRRQELAQ